MKERECLEDVDSDRKIILKWILKKSFEMGVDCTDLAQDRNNWRNVGNAVMKLPVS
jgi:hypothetical protein